MSPTPVHIVRHSLLPAILAGGLFLALSASAPLYAQMYKWTDANGRVTYSSTPPPGGQKAELIQLRGVETYTAGPSRAPSSGSGSASASGSPAQNNAAAAASQAKPAKPDEKGSAATDPNCTDGRTNCARGESPEFGYADRSNERVKPQFTIVQPPPKSK